MAYNELIKDVSRIRDYLREFFVYGFKSREQVGTKSTRSYDNEKRRIESWLSDYMSFRQDANQKTVFLILDSRHIAHNPFYTAWKAASFTKNDINLHFILLDILADKNPRSLTELIESIDNDYMAFFDCPDEIDVSTLRKKLKEYTEIGLINRIQEGKQHLYLLPDNEIPLDLWKDAVTFFSEGNPLGVIGSFILDKYKEPPLPIFSFKHQYFLFALDDGILLDLLSSIHDKKQVELETATDHRRRHRKIIAVPLKIYISTQGGRQYVAAYVSSKKRIQFIRIDAINKVKPLDTCCEFAFYQDMLKDDMPHVWGVSPAFHEPSHIEMTLNIDPKDAHIINRLKREKRSGNISQISETEWKFSADVYDPGEMIPWLRTFIGRICSLKCTDRRTQQLFWEDFDTLNKMYGGNENAL
ncbi:MAG: WYL domain-containing protein [Lachnospiraceae bacterium]|jgi:hypothetical protein|nr:WYL domain-containing protein [Lachnospiraceae bacterium]